MGVPALLLVTTGRTSGVLRRSPLVYVPWQGSFAVVGSNFGKPQHPGWTANLLALPEATVVVRGRGVPVRARLAEGGERAELWSAFVAAARTYQAYEERCGRELRLFLLDPVHHADDADRDLDPPQADRRCPDLRPRSQAFGAR
ncbi:nitroreductase/quinone reductase family protein [Streptomyces sp. NPDC048436]|uniref:nitroreductase/quinone reductase family protein n=1 Tax=Streptomyces sp. NPDC048436 TaxID=3365550 RepID=UPI00371E0B9C